MTRQLSGGVGSDNATLSSALGLNDLLIKSADGRLSLRDDVTKDPSLLARGVLSGEAGMAVGDSGIADGDNSIISNLVSAFTESHSFPASGDLGAVKGTLSDYASEIISHVAVLSQNAESSAEIKIPAPSAT